MAHEKYDEDVLVLTEDSWHGKHDIILPKGTDVETGFNVARLEDIEWLTKPLYIEVEPGMFLPFGDKKGLARRPFSRDQHWRILDNRTVRDYEVIDNEFLMGLAADLAMSTGWLFEGCGTLRHNEVSFIQLRVNRDIDVAGLSYERHTVRFFYGDDKALGSGFGGLTGTRIQCMNTFRMAISDENTITIPHREDPKARWEFINAQHISAINALEEQEVMLNKFFVTSLGRKAFQEFVEATYPVPAIRKSMVEAEQARDMLASGDTNGYDLQKVIDRGIRAEQAYNSEVALAERRRETLEQAYEMHNRRSTDSAETYYAAFQGLTWTANHSNVYRGDALASLLFNGVRGQDVKRGYETLVSMIES